MAKSSDDIRNDILERFEGRINNTIQDGSAVDLFIRSISDELNKEYQEIDDNKTPHIWTSLSGNTLDLAGTGVNITRETNEPDTTYKYRFLNWLFSAEASNESAIKSALLNPTSASNIDFVQYSKGAGTATCYVIPREYTEENIKDSLAEASSIISKVASPGLYVEYIVPEMQAVRLQILMQTDGGDLATIKSNITEDIQLYVNSIAPKDYLEVGEINRIGINTDDVTYFSVIGLYINDTINSSIKVMQGVDTKFIFDEITWEEASS